MMLMLQSNNLCFTLQSNASFIKIKKELIGLRKTRISYLTQITIQESNSHFPTLKGRQLKIQELQFNVSTFFLKLVMFKVNSSLQDHSFLLHSIPAVIFCDTALSKYSFSLSGCYCQLILVSLNVDIPGFLYFSVSSQPFFFPSLLSLQSQLVHCGINFSCLPLLRLSRRSRD